MAYTAPLSTCISNARGIVAVGELTRWPNPCSVWRPRALGPSLLKYVQSRLQQIRKRTALYLTDHFEIALVDAETLKVNGNTLVGQFPANLLNLISLEVLDLGDNQMSGMIPPTIANLASMSEFHDESHSLWSTIRGF